MGREHKYRSHLPVLKIIFDFTSIQNVFEYGCGLYSTKFFVEHAGKITSIEMQSQQWYDKVKKNIISDKLELFCKLGETDAIEYFKKLNRQYDLIFVDGIVREDCVRNAIGQSDIIVVHDLSLIRWEQKWKNIVAISDPYCAIIMELEWPNTAVITSNKELLLHLQEFKSTIAGGFCR